MYVNKMVIIIIGLSLITAMSILIFGKYIGQMGMKFLVLISSTLALIFSILNFIEILNGSIIEINWGIWLFLGKMRWSIDIWTAILLMTISLISWNVQIYALGYMYSDPHNIRFLSYLQCFTIGMQFLIISSNLIFLFIGWELIGFFSYLLINFYFTRLQANKSALKAVLVNRIGDIGIIIAISNCVYNTNALEINIINNLIYFLNLQELHIFLLFLLLGIIAKSVQFFLHIWLPDSMEGPTPVSALLHAATLVVAGIFLLFKFLPLLELLPFIAHSISLLGGITAFFGASIALVQGDIKRTIAFSTCSQLGYMTLALGVKNEIISYFHLVNHALFKSLLFLAAGFIIHVNYQQDLRRYFGNLFLFIFIFIVLIISSSGLIALPFISGFYSKDVILEFLMGDWLIHNYWNYWLGSITAFCTAFYSTKIILFSFFLSNPHLSIIEYYSISNLYMLFPLLILSILTIFWGFLFHDLFSVLHYDFYYLHSFYSFIPFLLSSLAIFLVWSLLFISSWYPWNQYLIIYRFLNQKWLLDLLFYRIFILPFLSLSFLLFIFIDRGFLDLFGPRGLIYITKHSIPLSLSSGFLPHYLIFFLSLFLFFLLTPPYPTLPRFLV